MITRLPGKITRFLTFLVFSLAAFGCGQEQEIEKEPSVLRIHTDTQRAGAFQSGVKVTIYCDTQWSVSLSDNSWAKIDYLTKTEGTGGSFTLTLSPNTGKDPRETVIKVTAGKGETTSTITQEGLDAFFRPSSISLSGTTASNVNFTSPYDWTAEIVSGKEWLILRTPSGKAGASVLTCIARDVNMNVGSREGAIRVKIGTVDVEIPVIQGQKDVILGEDSGTLLGWRGGSFTVHTQSNVVYTIDCGADWIEHTETRALNEATEAFLVKPNDGSEERSATVLFAGGNGITLAVEVVQGGKDPSLNFTKPGLYGMGGVDYVAGEDGWNQTGRIDHPDGTATFRLMNRGELSVISVEGILPTMTKDEVQNVTVCLQKKGRIILQGSYSVSFIDSTEELVWFKVGPDACFIFKK